MACFRCGTRQTDPIKGKSPWARLVIRGEQLLICPTCQTEEPNWSALADKCPECGSSKLIVMLDSVICRNCGRDFERREWSMPR